VSDRLTAEQRSPDISEGTAVREPYEGRVSRLGVADEDTAPPRVKATYRHFRDAYGYVPNWIKAVAAYPPLLQRYSNYYASLLDEKQGGLTEVERELIATIVSSVNGCTYCTFNHSGGLARVLGDGVLAQRLANNYREVDQSARHRAICEFAERVTSSPHRMEDAHFQALRDVGLSEDEIFQTLELAAFVSFSNRIAAPLALLPDPELFNFQRE
jgi:uncharacterized peroxidase-related enzyme